METVNDFQQFSFFYDPGTKSLREGEFIVDTQSGNTNRGETLVLAAVLALGNLGIERLLRAEPSVARLTAIQRCATILEWLIGIGVIARDAVVRFGRRGFVGALPTALVVAFTIFGIQSLVAHAFPLIEVGLRLGRAAVFLAILGWTAVVVREQAGFGAADSRFHRTRTAALAPERRRRRVPRRRSDRMPRPEHRLLSGHRRRRPPAMALARHLRRQLERVGGQSGAAEVIEETRKPAEERPTDNVGQVDSCPNDAPAEEAAKTGPSPRERDVLLLLAHDELTYLQIADRLGITEETVKSHVYNLSKKLHVSGRQQIVAAARELGWLVEEPAPVLY